MVLARLFGKISFTFFFMMSLLVPASSLASGNNVLTCAPSDNIAVNIKAIFDEPLINSSHSFAAIQQMSSGPGVIPHYDAVALGLTHYKPVVEFLASLKKSRLHDGTTCARIEKIDATIGYRDVTIYVAQELTNDTCAFEHVLEHERKHVAVNRNLLMTYVPYVQRKLTDYLHLYGTYQSRDSNYAEEVLHERASFVLSETSKYLVEENRRRQKLVDSPEEYAENNTACDGRLNAIVQHTKAKNRK